MGRPDYIFGQFRETARRRDVQHGGGVCCALAPQLLFHLTGLVFRSHSWSGESPLLGIVGAECLQTSQPSPHSTNSTESLHLTSVYVYH